MIAIGRDTLVVSAFAGRDKRDPPSESIPFVAASIGNFNVHQYWYIVLKWLAIVLSVVGYRWVRANRTLRDLFFILFGVFIIFQFLIV